MRPLLIVKVDAMLCQQTAAELIKKVKEGVEDGALVLGPECEIIAFDSEGRLAYLTERGAEL